MSVRKFMAANTQEALRKVKETMGPDAVVLSTRGVGDMVEVTAMPGGEANELAAAMARKPAPSVPPSKTLQELTEEEDYAVRLSPAVRAYAPYDLVRKEVVREEPVMAPRHGGVAEAEPPRREQRPEMRADPKRGSARRNAEAEAEKEQAAAMMAEIKALRRALEYNLAGFSWGELTREAPGKVEVLRHMLDAGFSPALARETVDDLAENIPTEAGLAQVRAMVSRRLLTVDNDDDLIDAGGVYALVGPTGVGKTTTTAKLAARCVMRHGPEKLALITTDGYRIGAYEQLRIYGRILGVPVHAVRDTADLRQTLGELSHKHMILIDTVGMGQRDRMVAEQLAMLAAGGRVRRLLLLNATSRGDTLDDVIHAYDGDDLAGCILSKVDEAASLAPAIDAVVRHGLRLFYVANGQRVPEDLHLPNRNYLLHRAFREADDSSPHRLQDAEYGLAMARAGSLGDARR